MNHSKLRLASRGVIVSINPDIPTLIEVYPYEMFPFFEGELNDLAHETEKTGKDAIGQKYTTKLKRTITITCQWLPNEHQKSPPSVVVGERVNVYSTGSISKPFFWESTGEDSSKRRGEVQVTMWNASSAEPGEAIEVTADNHYIYSVDTKQGLIDFKSSKDRDEEVIYHYQYDMKKGHYILEDDLKNQHYLDSLKAEFGWTVGKDSLDSMTLNTDGYHVSVDQAIELTSTTFSLTAKDAISLETKEFSLQAKEATVKAKKVYVGDDIDNVLKLLHETMGIVSSICQNVGTGTYPSFGSPPHNFALYPPLKVKVEALKVKLNKMI